MHRPTTPAILAAILAAPVLAQNADLIGTTLNTPLLAQHNHLACTPGPNCTPTGLPPTTTWYWAGGTAWDGATNTVWATTGQWLGRYGMNGCTVSCGVVPCPKSSPLAEATGLDVHDAQNQLWVIDDAGWITWCTNTCPPTVLGSCNTGLAISGWTATTGIAIDELRGLVFYSTSDFSNGSGTFYVAPIGSPCAFFQATPNQDCFNNPSLVTGIAVDAANSILYWTNGRGTMAWNYVYNPSGPSVTFTPGPCCIQGAPFPDPYTDLSIRWQTAASSGAPCANGACPSCPNVHLLRNAPLLGTTLQLGFDQAPVNVPAWCVLNFGTCNGNAGLTPLCGVLLVPLNAATFTLGMNVTSSGVGCNGSTTFPLPLPSNPLFAGTPMASQCIALCPPIGTAMSNCLAWVMQ